MASISAIAFNLVGSFVVFSSSMILFGCAVKNQNKFVAPRCSARPPTVIYNPSPDRDPCQDRGNPTFGWIPWAMGLTYETMLRGVPGTGTRNDGLSGALLKVNLDGIVLLRFHHLCLRVCIMACFLYLVVVLPLYLTAQCMGSGEDEDSLNCERKNFYATLDSYERLTLANIPILKLHQPDGWVEWISSLFLPVHNGLLARLYVVVFVAWMVTFYSLRELETEWGDGTSKQCTRLIFLLVMRECRERLFNSLDVSCQFLLFVESITWKPISGKTERKSWNKCCSRFSAKRRKEDRACNIRNYKRMSRISWIANHGFLIRSNEIQFPISSCTASW